MKHFLLILFSLFLLSSVFGQTNERLMRIVDNENVDNIEKIHQIHQLLEKEKGKVADTILVEYYLTLSKFAELEQDFVSAMEYCDTILKTYKKIDFALRINVNERKASIYNATGKKDKVIKIYLDILSEYEKRKDYREVAAVNGKIGVLFLKMDELESAELHLKEALRLAKQIGDKGMTATYLMSLGNRFKNEEKLDEAEKYYMECEKIAKAGNFKQTLAGNYNNYGSLFRMKKQYTQAIKYFELAIKLNKELGNDSWLSYNYNNIGNVYSDQGLHQKALDFFFKSSNIKKSLNDMHGQYSTFLNIASEYAYLEDYQQAYKFHKLYADIKDSLTVVDQLELSKKLAAEFQAEKRQTEILQLKTQGKLDQQQIKARDERISNQKFLGWMLGIGIFLVILIAIITWKSAISRKKANIKLVEKNKKIDAQHREIIDSINYAKRIQNSILPSEDKLSVNLLSYGVFYKPKDIVSGDFYVCEETNNGIYFGAVDCTGHGVPGAMVSLVASAHINESLHKLGLVETDEILNSLNKEIPFALNDGNSKLNDGFDISLCKLSKDRSFLQFSGANLDCWIICEKENDLDRLNYLDKDIRVFETESHALIELKGVRRGVGKSQDVVNFNSIEIKLNKGDKILLTTDGFKDQFGGTNNKKLNVNTIRKIVLENAQLKPVELTSKLEQKLHSWQGENDQVDDICVMIIEV